ncbi:MAG: nucleotidyltransferase [Armatimonadota bacterium]|nr:nucleotidyltransferase [bacterium]
MWNYVIPHFNAFLANLTLTPNQQSDIATKVESVGRCLYSRYYDGLYDSAKALVVGSHGKSTAIRPVSDIDVLFIMPVEHYYRVNGMQSNGQSYLLQEIRREMLSTFSKTDLSADGQVVVAPFTSCMVEVVPAFVCNNGSYITCNTTDGGSWRSTNPMAEFQAIARMDTASCGKATHLIKMLKAWKRNCNVDLKSIVLEIAVCAFVSQWEYRAETIFYYDWMVRDFFEFFSRYGNGTAQIPGINETLDLGDDWLSKCMSAYNRALKACEFEYNDLPILSEDEWKKIFGDQFVRAL